MAHVEDSEATSWEIGAGILGAEALHVTGPDGLLNGRVFNRQPLPVLHAAIQAGIHLQHASWVLTKKSVRAYVCVCVCVCVYIDIYTHRKKVKQ